MFFNWFLIFFDNWSPLADLLWKNWIDGMNSNANSPTWNCFRTGTQKKNKEHELVPSITRPFLPILELSNWKSITSGGMFPFECIAIPWGRSSLGPVSSWKLRALLLRWNRICWSLRWNHSWIFVGEELIINFNRLKSVYFKLVLCLIVILFIYNIRYVQYIIFFCKFQWLNKIFHVLFSLFICYNNILRYENLYRISCLYEV